MKRWQKALLFSFLWVALTIGAGILYTDVFLAGKITPQQDEQLSHSFGMACAIGILVICAFVFSRKRTSINSRPPSASEA